MSAYKEFFKHQMRKLKHNPRTAINIDQLPVTRIKRIMKQESCYGMRQISRDVAPFMAYAVQLFIGLITSLAWHRSAKSASRNTLMLKDLLQAYRACSKFDFLIDVATASVPPMPLIEMPLSNWSEERVESSSNAQTAQGDRAINAEPNKEPLRMNNTLVAFAAQDPSLKSHAATFDSTLGDELFDLIAD